ncbi:MAG: response regulator, partial [Chthoniobacterales bacterium]
MRSLLVDDEPGVAEALRELIGAHGAFDIKIATDGATALHEARSWPEGPDVLVTDVVMEPMDGFSLRDNLLGEFPNMRVVFATAYDLSGYADRLAGAAVVAKPVDAAQLLHLLSGSAAPSLSGTQIGGYLVQDYLGRHGSADEFVAWQATMSRHVVLHVLDEESSRDPAAVEAFLADARAKAAVS